jgi:radical SAM protein with 4Fe4S-binding SPASM domain
MKKFRIFFTRTASLTTAFFTGKRLINFACLLSSYLLRQPKVWGLPAVLQIEPTNMCDLNCQLCLTGQGRLKRKKGNMSLEDFKQVIEQFDNSLIYLVLYHMGESLLNKDIYEMISYAKQKRIFIRLSTNANFSDKKHVDSLLDSGIDELIISLDCATAQTYSEFKKSSGFEKVINNIRQLVKKRGTRTRPFISLQFLLMKSTENEVSEFKKLVKELKVDQGLMKKVRVDFNNEQPQYELLPENNKYLRDVYKNQQLKTVCWRPWLSVLVLWDRKVVPCCYDMEGENCFGDLKENNIGLIWNSQKYRQFRKNNLKSHDPDSRFICRTCSIRKFRKNFL